jgi:aspartate aminotransferase
MGTTIQIAKRITEMAESETLAMSRLSRQLRSEGKDVINLSLGEPDFNTPDYIKEAAILAIQENYSRYTPVQGYELLLDAICTKFKRDNGLLYSRKNIVVSTGAKQSIANVVMALINPGDEVLVPAPYWVSYREIIRLAGGVPVEVYAGAEKGFKVSAMDLSGHITSRTKMVLFSSPCNPTGAAYTEEELGEISNLFLSHPSIVVVSDEIYEHILFEGVHTSIASFPGMQERTVTVNGLSKAFAMTGWRLGYIGAPEEIAQACTKIQGQITSGACSITQRAAIVALLEPPERIYPMRNTFHERRDMMYSLLKTIPGFNVINPPGAFYFFPEVTSLLGKTYGGHYIETAESLCMYLLNEANVAVVPGVAFGSPQCIRISYAASEDELIRAVDRIKKAICQT